MWTTRDGYRVTMARFRARRLRRRLRARQGAAARLAALGRALALLLGTARRLAPSPGRPVDERHPIFSARHRGRPVVVVTRAVGPGRVELLFVGVGRPP